MSAAIAMQSVSHRHRHCCFITFRVSRRPRRIFAGSAIICLTHKPCYAPGTENSFYKFGKILFWV